ncbi:hypothetical protein GCM10027596_03360 [Nocardioides korecus]
MPHPSPASTTPGVRGPAGRSHPLLDRAAEARDRLAASDPGLNRLRTAASAAVAMGTALGVEAVVGRLLGLDPRSALVTMLLGAVVAMMGSNALVGPEGWGKVRNAAFFPVAVGIGMLGGALTAGSQTLRVVGFVLTMFVAVFVRRFGRPWFFYGFMGWMGFFFASFLKATPDMVPGLLVAVLVATVWVLLLSVTVFRTNPRKALASTLTAYFARCRGVLRACEDLLEVEAGPVGTGPSPVTSGSRQAAGRRRRAVRRVGAQQAGLAEAALLSEAWSEDPRALPTGWTGPQLRRRLLETQQAVDRVAGSCLRLDPEDHELVAEARRVVRHAAARRQRPALAAGERLEALARDREAADASAESTWWPARHVVIGVRDFLELDAREEDPPVLDPVEEQFEPTAQLVFGNLPGAPAVAADVRARGGRWNLLSRGDLATRQSVQVALAGVLAIAAGSQLSPSRYYWAVIAAFVTFTGTATRAETFLKAANRVIGTVGGLAAAIVLARLTQGNTPLVLATILGSVFLGFYLIKISYAWMIFFVTIMLGQLYTVLGTFSDALLVLRVEETAVGAAAGIVVALLVSPLSTRDTVRSSRDAVLEGLADLLDAVGSYAEGTRVDLDALTRSLDDRTRGLLLVARPLTRPLVVGNHSPTTRRRLGLYTSSVSHARALVVHVQSRPMSDPAVIAEAGHALAEAARTLARSGVGAAAPEAEGPLDRGDLALFRQRSPLGVPDPALRQLYYLHGALSALAGP